LCWEEQASSGPHETTEDQRYLNVFKYWPHTENTHTAWKDCIKAIDEGGRQLNLAKRRAMGNLTNSVI